MSEAGTRLHAAYTRTDWMLLATIAVVALAARTLPGLRIIDDAYITYRYALNIATGVGFVYNAGEAVLGTTTPLYTIIMALAGLATGNNPAFFPQISVIFNALFDAAGVGLLYAIARTLFSGAKVYRTPGVVLGLLWAIAPRSVAFAVGGMETSLYITLMLGAFCLWLYDRSIASALLTGLAVLTRPDALIWAGPLALAMIVQHWKQTTSEPILKRLPWAEGVGFAAVTIPWIGFSWLTFGSPLTNSVSAKAVAYILEPLQAMITLLGVYITPFSEDAALGEGPPLIIASVVYLILYVIGIVFFTKKDWRSLPLTLFPWLYLLTFSVANPLIFRWYASPPIPVLMLTVAGGVWALSRDLASLRVAPRILGAIGSVWLIFTLTAWEATPDHGPSRPAPLMAWFELELLYEDAAQGVAEIRDEDDIVAAGDIGAVGWYTRATLLDTLGIVSPESTTYYPLDPSAVVDTTSYAIAPGLIAEAQPDYIITLEAYVRNTLLQSPEFAKNYRLIRRIDTDIYGSDGMLVFERVR